MRMLVSLNRRKSYLQLYDSGVNCLKIRVFYKITKINFKENQRVLSVTHYPLYYICRIRVKRFSVNLFPVKMLSEYIRYVPAD